MSRPTRHEMPQNVLDGDMTSCQLLPTKGYIL